MFSVSCIKRKADKQKNYFPLKAGFGSDQESSVKNQATSDFPKVTWEVSRRPGN